MTRDELLQIAPDLLIEILSEGAAAERERIAEVQAQHLDGHGELIARLAFDGHTTGPEAALAVLAAERARIAERQQQCPAPTFEPHQDLSHAQQVRTLH